MNKITKKKLITECILGWYFIDDVLFGGNPTGYIKESSDICVKYNNLKKKYLKNLFEFYVDLGYKSRFNTLPKDTEDIMSRSYFLMEDEKKKAKDKILHESKKYSKMIMENINMNNDKLISLRTNYLIRSMMLENYFINTPLDVCYNNINLVKRNSYKKKLVSNLQELLDISKKYYVNF